jgi:hypothetical protein
MVYGEMVSGEMQYGEMVRGEIVHGEMKIRGIVRFPTEQLSSTTVLRGDSAVFS